jgi:alpha-galactosidase
MRWTVLVVVAAIPLMFSPSASPLATVEIPFVLANGLTARLDVSSPVPFGRFRQENGGGTLVWSTTAYEIKVTQEFRNGISFVRARVESTSQKPASVQRISLRVDSPGGLVDGVWTPSGRLSTNTLTSAPAGKEFAVHSAANFGIPYIAAATATGRNVLAVGLLQQDRLVEMHAVPLRNGSYQFRLTVELARNRTSEDYQFFVLRDGSGSWFETAEKYAEWVDQQTRYSAFPISDTAYDPVYDTWYWSQDEVDERLYLETGRLAADAGLGVFLADSGWDAPAGEYNRWLMGRTGDYRPPPEKFTNLIETFDLMRSDMGLRIQLWLQPFAVGRSSLRYKDTAALHIQIPIVANSGELAPIALPLTKDNLEEVNLCPRSSSTHRYLRDLFTEMSTTYHPDAYWLDFIDGMSIYCFAPHRHDSDSFESGFREALNTIRTTLLRLEKNPVVQFRAQYANLNTKPFANVWQPFDSPNDFDRMRLDTLRLRPFSKGVVMASDQLYWPSHADDATVAVFSMTSVMSGVPSIGANLAESRASSRTIVRNWMDFYRRYKEDLTTGTFRPFGSFRTPNHKIESGGRVFAYIRSDGPAIFSAGRRKQIFLLNASDNPDLRALVGVPFGGTYDAQVFDRYMQPDGGVMVWTTSRNVLDVNAVVERGGSIVLTPRN